MPSKRTTNNITSTLSPLRSTMIASAAVGISLNANELQNLPTSTITMSPVISNYKSTSPTPVGSSVGSPIIIHHTPLRSRDIGEDMEQIRLSRQDNPYLQKVAGSQASLVDEECIDSGLSDNEDTTQLVSQPVGEDVLSLSEVHEHLIRSPPPTVVPKTLSYFIFDTSITDKYKTLPPLKVNFNQVMLKDQEDIIDAHFQPVLETQRKLSVPKDYNITSVSAPNSPARIFRSDPYIRKQPTGPILDESHASILLGSGSLSDERYYKTELTLAPDQPPIKNPRVPEKVFLNNPRLSHVSSIKSPTRTYMSEGRNFKNSSLNATNNLPVNGSNLRLPIKCPHQPANTQVA